MVKITLDQDGTDIGSCIRNLSMKMRHLFFVISVVFPPSQDDLSRPPLAHEEEEVSFL